MTLKVLALEESTQRDDLPPLTHVARLEDQTDGAVAFVLLASDPTGDDEALGIVRSDLEKGIERQRATQKAAEK
jgi:hypothetical protein